jgi:hypothetical protein
MTFKGFKNCWMERRMRKLGIVKKLKLRKMMGMVNPVRLVKLNKA